MPFMGKLGDLVGTGISREARRWSITKHWPGMVTFMMLWPNAIQAAIYLAFKGNPDDHDEIFAAWNEKDKRFNVDVTPMFRTLGWVSKDNPKERIYMRFAKQAWEVVDIVEDPLGTAMGKSSAMVKMALEQMTGVDGMGKPLPFKNEDFWTGLFASEDGWIGGRAATIGGKFVPMSILSWLGGKPPSWLAPTSKGMVQNKAMYAAREILNAYADPSLWDKITKKDGYEKKLDTLIPEIIDAAERNGVDTKKMLTAANATVRSKYYDKFFRALNRGNETEMIEAA
jgi:hypothetical protein